MTSSVNIEIQIQIPGSDPYSHVIRFLIIGFSQCSKEPWVKVDIQNLVPKCTYCYQTSYLWLF